MRSYGLVYFLHRWLANEMAPGPVAAMAGMEGTGQESARRLLHPQPQVAIIYQQSCSCTDARNQKAAAVHAACYSSRPSASRTASEMDDGVSIVQVLRQIRSSVLAPLFQVHQVQRARAEGETDISRPLFRPPSKPKSF